MNRKPASPEAEAAQMAADLSRAHTLQSLDALYLQWVGYSMVQDAPDKTAPELRAMLADYLGEYCAAAGIDCPDIEARAEARAYVSNPWRVLPGECNPGY